MSSHHLYCDGGVIGRNPSAHGGTWAWCEIAERSKDWVLFDHDSGVVCPSDPSSLSPGTTVSWWPPKPITNNVTELWAAVHALTAAGRGWDGVLHTDSKVTMLRLTTGTGFGGVPQWLRLLTLGLRRGRRWKVELVGGHPTKDELLAGTLRRNGLPASKWNVWCDERCNQLAKEFLARKLQREMAK